ncbi:MAG: caspase family protein [Blastocatellia bacterium]|nr:caspase family protein [Blastocatellia bacterium]
MTRSIVLRSFFVVSFFLTMAVAGVDQESARGQRVSRNPSAPDATELDYDESHALVIGISRYSNGWRDLPGVRRDIQEVCAALEKHGFKVTVKQDLNKAELEQALSSFVGAYGQKPGNRLVIYFAGHGHTLTTNDRRPLGYLVPANAPTPNEKDPGPFKTLAISMSAIETHAREIESKHALFVFDSCFSGSLFRVRSNNVPDSISAATDQQVRQFITAGTESQTVPDVSIFRSQFVKALGGEADYDRDGYITGTELGYFLRMTVTDYTKKMQTPEYGKLRDPDLDKGDIVFRSPLGRAERPAPPAPAPRREEITLPPAEPAPAGESGRWTVVVDQPIRVEANQGWVDTGIQIKAGQEITIRSGGVQINLGAFGKAGPNGVYKDDARKPFSACPTGALIAKIDEQPFCIQNQQSFQAAAGGRLRLGVNESNVSDNQGAWVVKVVVQEFRK